MDGPIGYYVSCYLVCGPLPGGLFVIPPLAEDISDHRADYKLGIGWWCSGHKKYIDWPARHVILTGPFVAFI